MSRQRPSGCPRLAKALRETLMARQVTPTQASKHATEQISEYSSLRPISRSQISQFMHAHRSPTDDQLWMIEKALNVKFEGVNRNAHSPHHMQRVCKADLGSGHLCVTCRSTGETLYDAG